MDIKDCKCGDCLNVVVDAPSRGFCFACEDAQCEKRHADGKPECNVRGAYGSDEAYGLASLRATGAI